ncbi:MULTISPECIES: hypothetical protein [Rhodopirellula]|uniref:hypothetical protein n=1 Tax=Rhodopirellula TaxID=265488 RepID=UPI00257E5269|nr:hypothetical protein [Rhodopirellula sp. UBA1907]|tara:strand:- start:41 stop:481 length:441 start_codon:yes stop_codon:yes gene_type:complete
MVRLILLVVVASILQSATSGHSAEPQAEPRPQDHKFVGRTLIQFFQQVKQDINRTAFDAQMSHYRIYGTNARFVIRANRELLKSSLMVGVPNAAIEYEARAREIEALAKESVRSGAASEQDLALAKSARLDTMLSGFLIPADVKNN